MAQGVHRVGPDGSPRRTLLIIGGAEDKLGRSVVLKRFVRLAGGRQSRIVIIPTASSFVDEVVESYSRVFTRLRAGGDIRVVHAASRAAAHDPDLAAELDGATAVFMTVAPAKTTALPDVPLASPIDSWRSTPARS